MRLDEEVQTLLDALNAGFPRVEKMTGAEARAAVQARKQVAANPDPVQSVTDTVIAGPGGPLSLRLYQPCIDPRTSGTGAATPKPVIVFAHGGGFVFCDLDSHDEFCRAMTNAVGAVVVSVDYRLAPEHPAPAAALDVHAALSWVRAHAGDLGVDLTRVVVAGDSAGGNLAAVTALIDREGAGPALAGQVLIYPVIDNDFDTPSYLKYAEGYFNTRDAMRWYWQQYAPAGVHNTAHPHHISPARADTLGGLPPTIIITAACDPLRDEGIAYAERLRTAEVPTIHRCYEGVFHGFMTIPSLTITGQARTRLWADLAKVLD